MKTPILAIALGLALGAAVPASTFAQHPTTSTSPIVRDDPSHDGHGARHRQRRERRRQHHQRHGQRHNQRQHHAPADAVTSTSVEFGAF